MKTFFVGLMALFFLTLGTASADSGTMTTALAGDSHSGATTTMSVVQIAGTSSSTIAISSHKQTGTMITAQTDTAFSDAVTLNIAALVGVGMTHTEQTAVSSSSDGVKLGGMIAKIAIQEGLKV